jgi:hypothetical protein
LKKIPERVLAIDRKRFMSTAQESEVIEFIGRRLDTEGVKHEPAFQLTINHKFVSDKMTERDAATWSG